MSAGSYGSTKRYKNIDRIIKVNGSTLLGAGGELSDFAHIAKLLDELVTEDFVFDDGVQLTAPEAHAYLTRVMYNRRNKCARPPRPPLMSANCCASQSAAGCFGPSHLSGQVQDVVDKGSSRRV